MLYGVPHLKALINGSDTSSVQKDGSLNIKTMAQYAISTLNKTDRTMNKNHTGLTSTLQGFQIYFA